MALVQYSGLVTSMHGKLSGSVLQQSAVGPIIRKTKNFNRTASPYMQAAKVTLGAFTPTWQDLSIDELSAWKTAQGYTTYKKKPLVAVPIRGYALYVQLNMNLLNAGLPTITAPPLLPEFPNFEIISVDSSLGTYTMNMGVSFSMASGLWQWFATPVLRNGKTPSWSMYRKLNETWPVTTTSMSINYAIYERYGYYPTGGYIWVAVRIIDANSGMITSYITGRLST